MIALLLSIGRHPVSGRPRIPPSCGCAAELALRSGRPVTALHVGDPGNAALRYYLGMGLKTLTVLDPGADEVDALPLLETALRRIAPAHLLCGASGEIGEGSGLLPYLLAERRGMAVLPGVIAFDGDTAVQRPSLTEQRYFRLDRPTVLIAGAGAPAARPVAFAKARAGKIDTVPVSGRPDPLAAQCDLRPARQRPKRLSKAQSSGATQAGALTGLSAEAAALCIRDFLVGVGALDREG